MRPRGMVRKLVPLGGVIALVVVAGCGSSQSGDPSTKPSSSGSSSQSTATASAAPPGKDWQAEYYKGVQLLVPPGWVAGTTPLPDSGGQSGVCEPDATQEFKGKPYVGRPGTAIMRCAPDNSTSPEVDAVWFDSPLPTGTKGQAETVKVGDQKITVRAPQATRATIVASIKQTSSDPNGCPTQTPNLRGWPREGITKAERLSVCVYDKSQLYWSQQRTLAQARAFWKNLRLTPPATDPSKVVQGSRQIVVYVTGKEKMGTAVSISLVFDPARLALIGVTGSQQTDSTSTDSWFSPALLFYHVNGPEVVIQRDSTGSTGKQG